ncbi:hypothetical protein TeGR_g7686, partial [Tetraparma gracilis]
GRFAVAKSRLPPGTTVLLEAPLVNPVLNASHYGSRCRLCFGPVPLSPLGVSAAVEPHCSERCARLDPDYEHDRRGAAAIHPHEPTPTVLLGCRLLRLLAGAPDLPAAKAQAERFVANLEHFSREETEAFEAMAAMVGRFSQLSAATPDERDIAAKLGKDWLVALVARLSQNGFTVADSECQPLGMGLYEAGSAVNHSCCPTVVSSFKLEQGGPPKLKMRTCRDVREGGELSNAYIDVGMPVAARRRELKESYCFECECEACRDFEKDVWVEGRRCAEDGCKGCVGWKDGKRACVACGREGREGQEGEGEGGDELSVNTVGGMEERRLEEVWRSSYKLSHARLCSGNELVMRYIDQQRFGDAAKVLKGTMEAMDFCLFENSPVVGVGLFKLVKLLEYEEVELELAGRLRARAADVLRICYGEDDPLYKEVIERW